MCVSALCKQQVPIVQTNNGENVNLFTINIKNTYSHIILLLHVFIFWHTGILKNGLVSEGPSFTFWEALEWSIYKANLPFTDNTYFLEHLLKVFLCSKIRPPFKTEARRGRTWKGGGGTKAPSQSTRSGTNHESLISEVPRDAALGHTCREPRKLKAGRQEAAPWQCAPRAPSRQRALWVWPMGR